MGMKRAASRRRDALFWEAHKELTRALLLNVSSEALSAESGTGQYGYENILGVGIAEKEVDGEPTGERCLAVYVMAKASRKRIAREALVPKTFHGVSTDVVPVGEITAFPYRGRYRPAQGGVSLGHVDVTTGTLGCLVERTGRVYVLSNNHVLANVNAGRKGDPIVQPGSYDGGKHPQDTIARLAEFVPIRFGGDDANVVDAAIAEPEHPEMVMADNIGFGSPAASIASPRLNLGVRKTGRTTQETTGRITGMGATIRVSYGKAGVALFTGQLVIRGTTAAPFSQGGDSGSLIVTRKGNRPVALLFAGSASHTIATPIGDVLNALGLSRIVT